MAKTDPSLIEVFDDVEQGSPEWFALRLGIPTASGFSMVIAEGKDNEAAKTRKAYMNLLAGEILTGKPAEGRKIVTAAMQRGNEMEPRAIDHYSRRYLAPVERIGFIRRRLPSGRFTGCSPDGRITKRKALEIKTMAPDLMIDRLERGAGLPPEHVAQVYGTMWVGDFDEVDLMIYYDGMPVAPKFTIPRHEKTIQEISNAVEIFDHELDKLVKRIRAMGG